MWLKPQMPPQKGPATLPRIKAQTRSRQIEMEEQREWGPKIAAVEARYQEKWCGHCGYEKRVGGICTRCFRI